MKAFCASATILVLKEDVKLRKYPTGFYAGQPVLVKMPQIGTVLMVLTTPKNLYTWEVKDSSRKLHRISTRW